MTSNPTSAPFGAACSDGGDWYACGNGPQFVGCCTSDACSDQGCPAKDVRPATFDSSEYGKFPDQGCTQGKWYVCAASDPPFMGCCTSNACQTNGCPASDLRAGSLSSNESAANAFEPNPPLSSTSTSSSTTLPTATSSTEPTSTPGTSSTPKIAGSVVGGVAVLVLIIALLLWRWRRYLRASRKATQDAQEDRRRIAAMGGSQGGHQYRDSDGGQETNSTRPLSFEYTRGYDPVTIRASDNIPLMPSNTVSPPSSAGQVSREPTPQPFPSKGPNQTRTHSNPPAQRYRAYSRPHEADVGLLSTQYRGHGYTQIASEDGTIRHHFSELAAANENA